jgi:hypothetical protein
MKEGRDMKIIDKDNIYIGKVSNSLLKYCKDIFNVEWHINYIMDGYENTNRRDVYFKANKGSSSVDIAVFYYEKEPGEFFYYKNHGEGYPERFKESTMESLFHKASLLVSNRGI